MYWNVSSLAEEQGHERTSRGLDGSNPKNIAQIREGQSDSDLNSWTEIRQLCIRE